MTERGLKNINVFYSTFTNVFFYFCHVFLTFFNVFLFFLERFFTSMVLPPHQSIGAGVDCRYFRVTSSVAAAADGHLKGR